MGERPLDVLKAALDKKVILERITAIRYREEHHGSSIGGKTIDSDKIWLCDQLSIFLNGEPVKPE